MVFAMATIVNPKAAIPKTVKTHQKLFLKKDENKLQDILQRPPETGGFPWPPHTSVICTGDL